MKIEKINKDNISEFIKDISTAKEIEDNINKMDYYAVKEDDIYLLGFEMLSDDDRIAIKYINSNVDNNKFINIIDYLNNVLVVKSHLIINLYDNKYMDILDDKYNCKDIYVSLVLNNEDSNSNFREELAEIDMHNIRYLNSKNEIVCNLVKQNIQDEKIILELNSVFVNKNSNIVSFIISDNLSNLFNELDYNIVYKSYIVNN